MTFIFAVVEILQLYSFNEEKTSFESVKKALNKTIDELLNGQKLTPSLEMHITSFSFCSSSLPLFLMLLKYL